MENKTPTARNSTAENNVPIDGIGIKTVYVGKDKRPVLIKEVVPFSEPAWKRSFSDSHSAADIINLIANELPIDTETSFLEADDIASCIKKAVYDAKNLKGSMFMNSSGNKTKTFNSVDLKERPADLEYFAFVCVIDTAETIDDCIIQARLSLNFCIKLPQSV